MPTLDYCKGCKKMTLHVCAKCEIEPGPATRAMLEWAKEFIRLNEFHSEQKRMMEAFRAEWPEGA